MALVIATAAFLRFWRLDSLPLGFHHDEALDAISALEIWTKGQRPIFFPQQGSREPFMIYVESLGILALGATRLGARVMQALAGTVGVAVAWLLFRELFSRRVALLATGFMAVSFWAMFESRLGLRAISQPLFEALCLLFFWRTLTHRRWRDAVLAGLFLGVTMYTYTASRALPVLMVALVLWQVATSPSFMAKQWSRMLVVAGVGLAVFAPLGGYALRHPDEFLGRSLQVSLLSPEPYSGASGSVLQAAWGTLGMFSFVGDPEWKYNIGGQPVFDWPVSALLYAGVIVALAGIWTYLRRPRRERPDASPHAFALIVALVMLLPGALSAEAPHFLRTIGVMPALFAFPALAIDLLVGKWRGALPLAALLLVGEGWETGWRYFHEWAGSPAAYYAMQADAADVGAYFASHPPDEPALFSSEYPGHPTLLYLAPKAFDQIRWFNGRQSLAFPPSGQPAEYVFTAEYQPPFLDVGALFGPSDVVAQGADPSGAVAWRIFRSPSPPAVIPARPLSADVGGGLAHLTGVSAPSLVAAGSALELQEYWQAMRAGTPDVRAYLHVVDAQGHVWAQATGIGFYAEDWQPGDSTVNDQQAHLPAYTPPLPMDLRFGFFLASTGQQLGPEVLLGIVQVQGSSAPEPGWSPPHAVSRPLAAGLTLVGWDAPSGSVRAGDALPVRLYWQVTGTPSVVPALDLADLGAHETGLRDLLPPDRWPQGIVEDQRDLTVAADAKPGTYTLRVGGFELGDVTVTEPQRDYSLPAMQHPLGVPVGDFATLAGYSEAPGQPLKITLVWQDRMPVTASYKVFVHVLDESQHVIAQRDDFPQSGAMPTTLWLPGQVVADSYDVPLPASLPAGAQLEVGMYEPSSGTRLTIGSADRLLLPLAR
ncbi:MAG: glycosyltransferase family 39 protein [Chloroflexi bacterium]|nr:glycosyltransferase family 39 protein [Chloroflexota bacterium]